MKALAYRVLGRLASGEFESGAALARTLGVSRGSVWNAVRELEDAGLEIYRVRGRGYRLQKPVTLIDPLEVALLLGADSTRYSMEVALAVDSTNSLALERARAHAPSGTVIAAEWQTNGRGRLGRAWHTALAGGLTFSLVWRFARGAAFLSGLSLAVGVALVRALKRAEVPDAKLKWPNDVVWNGSKLAGILIEMQGDALGPTCAVIGIGVNVRLTQTVRCRIDQAATDLETTCGRVVDRNALLAAILGELTPVLERFEQDGFAPLRSAWQRHHAWQGRRATISLPDGRRESGVVHGVDDEGALLVAIQGRMRRYHSGEVTVRGGARANAGAGAAT